jgi:hypothetical protein
MTLEWNCGRGRKAAAYTARCSTAPSLVHPTLFPRDSLDDFGFVPCVPQGRVELWRVESEAFVQGEGTSARSVKARTTRVTAALSPVCPAPGSQVFQARAATLSSRSSAIWIAFRAAPLRRLSLDR